MIDVSVKVNQDQLHDIEQMLSHIPTGAPRAISRAINRTMEGTRTQLVRDTTGTYFITAGDVRETITIQKANLSKLRSRLTSRGSTIGLQHFRYSPKKARPRPKIGVRAQVRKDSRMKPNPGSFLIDEKIGVFRRVGKSRFPIERLSGPAVPSMLTTVVDEQGILDQAGERFDRELNHEVDWLLKRSAK